MAVHPWLDELRMRINLACTPLASGALHPTGVETEEWRRLRELFLDEVEQVLAWFAEEDDTPVLRSVAARLYTDVYLFYDGLHWVLATRFEIPRLLVATYQHPDGSPAIGCSHALGIRFIQAELLATREERFMAHRRIEDEMETMLIDPTSIHCTVRPV